jgi:hypothetical protein
MSADGLLETSGIMIRVFRRINQGKQRNDIQVDLQEMLFIANNEFSRLVDRIK